PPGGNARGLLRGVVECPAHFACTQTGGAGRGGRSAKGTGNTVWGQTALVAELKTAHGQDYARAEVLAERHGTTGPSAVDAEWLAGRKRCRYNRAARVRARGVVRVVGLVRMSHDSIRERGINRRGRKRRSHDRRSAFSSV